MMNRPGLILLVIILLAACTPAEKQVDTTTVVETVSVQNLAVTVPVPTETPVPTATGMISQASATESPVTSSTNIVISPTVMIENPMYSEYTSGSLWLHLFGLHDEDLFSEQEITVSGQAPAETVISLNDEIYLVNEDESFSIPVQLEEGPNVIEIVASNVNGDEIDLVLTIIYEEE